MSELEGVIKDDGERREVHYSIRVGSLFWKGEEATIINISDISHIHEYQEALGNHKDQILGSFSHNLKTPLNGISGMVDAAITETTEKSVKYKLDS